MNKDILLLAEVLSNEKGVEKSLIFSAIEAALATATRKGYATLDLDARVSVNTETGEYDTFRVWHVVEDEAHEFPEREYTLAQAREIQEDLELGDVIEEPLESIKFGRIEAQAAKQVIIQEVRKAMRAKMVQDFEARIGELLTGTVKKVTREMIFVDLGNNAEAIITRDQMIPRELVRMNDRIRGYLFAVNEEGRVPQILLSRTHPDMLKMLFEIEVPEVSEGIIEIKAVARDPGNRAKIAVKTNDGRIDPIGACVGMRGARVQAVSTELGGERVDIVLWDDNPAQLAINVLSPAEVGSIVVDEESRVMDIAVAEEQLALAIGRSGQNIRLASELTGWKINVMNAEEAEAKSESEAGKVVAEFMETLSLDEALATALVEEGFSSIEEIAYVDEAELLAIDALVDEEAVAALRNSAKDALLAKALMGSGENQPQQDLLEMDGMTDEVADLLAAEGICSMEDLAEQAVIDLLEIDDLNLTEAEVSALIMTARAPWFN